MTAEKPDPWSFVIADVHRQAYVVAAFQNGVPWPLGKETLPERVITMLGCTADLMVKPFKNAAEIYHRRKEKIPRRAAQDVLSADGKRLSIVVDFANP